MADTLKSKVDVAPPSAERALALRGEIARHRATFEGASRLAEEERTLPAAIVDLMRRLGLFWLKTPIELGGSELDPLDFCDVLEDLAYCDASAAWACMVGNGTTGTMAGWLDEAGVREVFAGPELPICAGQYVPRGTGVAVEGGYRVTGRWTFSSGIRHSGWVVGGFRSAEGGPPLLAIVPKSEATVYDTWHVAGLQGTGSGDFSLSDTFVPTFRTLNWTQSAPQRGGLLYRQDRTVFLANELSPVAVGVARRALDDLRLLVSPTTRLLDGSSLQDRAVFQWDLGRGDAQLRSLRLLYRQAVQDGWEAAQRGEVLEPAQAARFRADYTFAVENCSDLVSHLFRYGGGRVLGLDHPLQRHVRNLMAAAQHLQVSNESYELAGRSTLPARPA